MERYLQYNREFRLGICITCKVSIPLNCLQKYFRIHHKSTWFENRDKLRKYSNDLDLCEKDELQHPSVKRDAIQGLEIKEGWCCGENGCMYVSVSIKHVKNHCRLIHGVEARQRKSWFNCRMQSLLGNPNIRYLY